MRESRLLPERRASFFSMREELFTYIFKVQGKVDHILIVFNIIFLMHLMIDGSSFSILVSNTAPRIARKP